MCVDILRVAGFNKSKLPYMCLINFFKIKMRQDINKVQIKIENNCNPILNQVNEMLNRGL